MEAVAEIDIVCVLWKCKRCWKCGDLPHSFAWIEFTMSFSTVIQKSNVFASLIFRSFSLSCGRARATRRDTETRCSAGIVPCTILISGRQNRTHCIRFKIASQRKERDKKEQQRVMMQEFSKAFNQSSGAFCRFFFCFRHFIFAKMLIFSVVVVIFCGCCLQALEIVFILLCCEMATHSFNFEPFH